MKPALFVAKVTRPSSIWFGLYFSGWDRQWATRPEDGCRRSIHEWCSWLEENDRGLLEEMVRAGVSEPIPRFSDGVVLEPAP